MFKKNIILGCITFVILSLFVSVQVFCQESSKGKGKSQLYLVGMGPGDADLISVRGLETIKKADLIVCPSKGLRKKFDTLLKKKEMLEVSHGLWGYYGDHYPELQRGKPEEHKIKQADLSDFINKVRQAVKKGKTIAVLESGDPFIYGPWNWVLEEFKDLNPVAIPGISCFNAANAALQKDVCRGGRDFHAAILTSGYGIRKWGYEKLGMHNATRVIFTMGSELEDLIKKLSINHSPKTPVAIVVHAGYMDKEKIIRGNLGTILEKVGEENLTFEYMVYMGDFLTHRWK